MKDIISLFSENGISLSDDQAAKLNRYYELLVEYNEKVNLTNITEYEDVCIKHFLDSCIIMKDFDFESGRTIIDIGTGAGFPGIPLKILNPNLNVYLLDTLTKRINFLKVVASELDLEFTYLDQRAEEIPEQYRAKFDYVTSRAVASLNVLSEYCIPYLKTGGTFIVYKGPLADDEIKNANNALDILGGKITDIKRYNVENLGERNILYIKKVKETPEQYPRKYKKIKTKPL